MGALLQDLRYALRMLAKSPGFTLAVLAALALGIGANTAIFTVLNTVVLHSLPYPDAARIMNILRQGGGRASIPMFTYWAQSNSCFDDLTAYGDHASSVNLGGADRPELVQALKVSVNYFRLFGAYPILGRSFTADEDRMGGPQVLVMSYGLWVQRFGGDPAILGKAINLGGTAYVVIGVLSPGFKSYPPTDVWVPLQADPNSTDQAHIFMVAGRLRQGVTRTQANSEMVHVGKLYIQTHPQQLGNDERIQVVPVQQQMTGDVKPALLILLGAVGLVLLIACANVANLLLARGTGRQREIAVRAALGAGRGRIVRQLLAESLMLAIAGGVLGLWLGSSAVRAIIVFTPGDLPRIQEMAHVPALNPWVAGFTVLLSIVTGLLFGLFPAFQLSRTDLALALKESTDRTGGDLRHNRSRAILVTAEVGIAVVLLSGAVLLIRSFVALHSVDPGFDPQNLLTLTISLDGPKYASTRVVDGLAHHIVEKLERIPGIEAATLTSGGLPFAASMDMAFDIPGRPPERGFKFTGDVLWPFISGHYFQALGVPLASGRLPRDGETSDTVVINQAMARRFWPNQNPVGQTILIGAHLGHEFEEGPVEIVGVVGDVRDRLDFGPPPIMYQARSQVPEAANKLVNGLMPATIIVRTKPGVAPLSVGKAVREALMAGDTGLPAIKIQTMEQVMIESTARQNFNLLLLGVFAGIALLLAAVGIYGVSSYSVENRTHEIGVRMAIGASRGDILRLVVGQGIKMTLIGVAIGITGALGLTRVLERLLYRVKPTDPLTFVVVSLVLFVVALLAMYIPARRATKVDPMVALRYE